MELPILLQKAIEEKIENIKLSELRNNAKNLSGRYMEDERTGKTLLNNSTDALAYAIIRMPATYCADKMALKYTLSLANCEINSVLDVGSGTGAMPWAINDSIDVQEITCIERENVMSALGKKLMQDSLKNVKWKEADILKDDLEEKADLVTASYVINELNEKDREYVIDKLYKAANKILLIIETGTPKGFEIIKQVQEYAKKNNAYIIAPCTSQEKQCKLGKDDWCHATVRVQRSKIHKYLKEGEAPYEDEKFSYIAISKEFYGNAEKRILRHPIIENGKITLKICNHGNIEEMVITKKDKELFKSAKKKNCGDEL